MITMDLGGLWQARTADGEHALSARVPGDVHGALLEAGMIPDPFYRDNEDALLWIGERDWIFSRTFEIPEQVLQSDRVLLRCQGLDTLGEVLVNDQVVGETDNMFRTWEFDLKGILQPGENTIEVRFASPIPYIHKRQAERSIPSWGGPKEVKGRAWVRKEPCNFGWDWGPVVVTCGIWRPVSIIAFDTARIDDVAVSQTHSDGKVQMGIDITASASGASELVAEVAVALDGETVARAEAALEHEAAHVSIDIDDPQLWWPNGMGEQPLYDVSVSLRDGRGAELDAAGRRIGLRTLVLDRHADEWGESFQFVVNGEPFFAKGANWIPADAVLARMTPERYHDLIRSAADANMNMLRVWGGGIYEDDAFYAACDELGICIWQDFMFSCSTYPSFDAAFMATVAAELRDNVRRLRHHPCIALWCGNNELEQGLVGDEWNDHQMSWEDYGKLFDELIPGILAELDPARDYWPCSPHTPCGDRKDFNNPDCGDAHLWSVWHGRQPFEWYRTCTHRFNSEFGFQSFPEPKTVSGYTAPEDRNVTTYVMEHHQRSAIGNTAIMQYMLDWFRLPTCFDMTLWLSQILQGMAMKYAVEHWRRAMPRGMGTLYWQLNDCWPVASWASIDYHGRWKALQYMAKAFNAPLLVSGVEDASKGTVEVHVTSDRLEAASVRLSWSATTVCGEQVAGGSVDVESGAQRNTLVETLDLSAQLAEHGPRDLLVWLTLTEAGEVISTNLVTFSRPKHLGLQAPGYELAIEEAGDGAFDVTLTAPRPALWVWLELEDADARYSDNFFHLRPDMPVCVRVTPAEPIGRGEFVKRLAVRSLVDTYAV